MPLILSLMPVILFFVAFYTIFHNVLQAVLLAFLFPAMLIFGSSGFIRWVVSADPGEYAQPIFFALILSVINFYLIFLY